jgi:hypothetical protein
MILHRRKIVAVLSEPEGRMSRESWILLLLSIPVSLVTGLLIRPIQLGIERSKKGWQSRQAERQKDDYASTLIYMLQPERFTQNLIFAVFGVVEAISFIVVGFGATTLMLVAVLPATLAAPHNSLHGVERGILWGFGIMGGVLNSGGSYQLNKVIRAMYKARRRMVAFDSYVKMLPESIKRERVRTACSCNPKQHSSDSADGFRTDFVTKIAI